MLARSLCTHRSEVIEDVKGVETPEFKIKHHLMKALLGWEVQVIK
ncbi:hypothetical protein [Comamonas sp.]|nr:hypothetical protein [Comamonas sp.]